MAQTITNQTANFISLQLPYLGEKNYRSAGLNPNGKAGDSVTLPEVVVSQINNLDALITAGTVTITSAVGPNELDIVTRDELP